LIDKTGKEIIPCKYDYARYFSQGYVVVQLNGKSFHVIYPVFSLYAGIYVDQRINAWAKQGASEETTEWQTRVNETTRKAMADNFLKEAEQVYITRAAKQDITLSLNDYDANNEVFLINTANILDEQNIWKLHVPTNRATYFKESWDSIEYSPKYVIENDKLFIAEMKFKLPNGEEYTYKDQN
jgi:hypothetical protein